MQEALIYCRVSSQRQIDEGNGNKSQEQRCRLRANEKGYKIEKIFHDDGISGGLFERPAMQELINYLDKHQGKNYVIIFDDLSRFARDVKVHIQLKAELVSRGAKLECLNFNFDDSEESEYAELVLAAGNQYQRKQNRRQVIQKMKARLEQGYWPFCPPPALSNKENPIYGKTLYPKEPYATIFKEAIENFNNGILNTLEEAQIFINLKYRPLGIKPISINGAWRILTNVLYTGWIEYKPWGIPLQKAKHEGFITKETYDQVQNKLYSKSKNPLRRDYNLDFPLRGFILCSDCRKPMTASWHKGRNKKYAHYFCKQIGCPMFGKVVQKSIIEAKFEGLITDKSPNKDVLLLVKELLKENWIKRESLENNNKRLILDEIKKLEEKKRQFMDRIANSTNEAIIKEYEKEIELIIKKRQEIEVNLPMRMFSNENFGTACDLVLQYVKNPVRMWQSPNYKDKRLLLEMYFDDKLTYDIKEGFGTVNLACLVSLLTTKDPSKIHLVEMPGVEPGSEETHLK